MLSSLLSNDAVKRALHTFWQAFMASFLVSASGLLDSVLAVHNLSDAKAALLALAVAALAAAMSALKSLVVSWMSSRSVPPVAPPAAPAAM